MLLEDTLVQHMSWWERQKYSEKDCDTSNSANMLWILYSA